MVDDDVAVRKSLRALSESAGLAVETYASGEEFLAAYDPENAGCLVLDVRLQHGSGLDLQDELRRRKAILPIIVLTGHGDVQTSVRALKAGAVDFLQKPAPPALLLERICAAIDLDRRARTAMTGRAAVSEPLAALTPHERVLMELLIAGKPSKEVRQLGLSVSESCDDDSAASGIIAALTPPSERKRVKAERGMGFLRERAARRKAEAASQSKDELLATVAHELRSPTNAIVMWAHLLRSGSLDQNATQRALDGIDRGARLQALLIDDLLDVSRIVTGKLALNVCPVDLRRVVEDAVASARPSAESKQIRFEADLLHSPVMVACDTNRLQQVFSNVLSNAIKFTPAAGRVATRFRTEADRAVVTVTDSGCGISPAFLSHVFEPFRQANASTTRAHGGLGLGLAIAHQLVAQHGGTVTAESPGEGQGATFIVSLPTLATRGIRVASSA